MSAESSFLEAVRALSDEEIVQRVRDGETALFEILMRRHNQRIYRVARAILKGDTEAEDVMQQAYVNAYTHLHQFADRARFSTWLTRIAIHEALAQARRRGRQAEIQAMTESDEVSAELWARTPDPERAAFATEIRHALEEALDALPVIYRSVFVLRDVEGLTTQEAAACLEVTEDTVKTRLLRARALLREELLERAGLAAADAFPFFAPRCDRVVAAVFRSISGIPPGPPSGRA
jgi:RNA polymerase sigma-70 factor, ECF subfamily